MLHAWQADRDLGAGSVLPDPRRHRVRGDRVVCRCRPLARGWFRFPLQRVCRAPEWHTHRREKSQISVTV